MCFEPIEIILDVSGDSMSCLTRKLQQNLTRYLKRHNDVVSDKEPEAVRDELINMGLCPSHVTNDQMRDIMRSVNNS